ncbi:MAG: ABC transporter permease, partial [Ktedonobacteraceae bacterium]|nr:ABC transporter permease [Ktedonobacteraceae bacterium]
MASTIPYKAGSNKAAPFLRQVLIQVRYELLLTLRRGENILVTLIVPVLLLIFFSSLNIIPAKNGSSVNFLLPGILALAIIAAGMVNLGIATAYERYYGVLKRLGSSPLSRSGLILAKVISILLLEIVQVLLLVGVAVVLYKWQPAGSALLTLGIIALGTIT